MPPSELQLRLRALGLRVSAEALNAVLLEAERESLTGSALLDRLCAIEERERASRNLVRRTKLATLGSFTTLDRFDWNHPRVLDRTLYQQLLALDFARAGQNVLLRGPSGVGKTTLAQNLALHALQQGLSVRFCTLAAALADLLRQESAAALERRLKRYTHPHLLVLDELGFLPCDSRSADLLTTSSAGVTSRSPPSSRRTSPSNNGRVSFREPRASSPSSTVSPSIAMCSILRPTPGVRKVLFAVPRPDQSRPLRRRQFHRRANARHRFIRRGLGRDRQKDPDRSCRLQ